LARAASLICMGYLLLMVAGEMLNPHAPPPSTAGDIVGLNFFLGMYGPGLLLAWRNELLGGSISLLGMLAFYEWVGVQDGSLPRGWILPLLALPAGFSSPRGLSRLNTSKGLSR
jgi:hypothetical protein